MPLSTLAAFRDHGKARLTLGLNDDEAEGKQGRLQALDFNLRSIRQELTDERVGRFIESHDATCRLIPQCCRNTFLNAWIRAAGPRSASTVWSGFTARSGSFVLAMAMTGHSGQCSRIRSASSRTVLSGNV